MNNLFKNDNELTSSNLLLLYQIFFIRIVGENGTSVRKRIVVCAFLLEPLLYIYILFNIVQYTRTFDKNLIIGNVLYSLSIDTLNV